MKTHAEKMEIIRGARDTIETLKAERQRSQAVMVSAMASLAFAYGYLANLGHEEAATRMYAEAEAIKAALGCSPTGVGS